MWRCLSPSVIPLPGQGRTEASFPQPGFTLGYLPIGEHTPSPHRPLSQDREHLPPTRPRTPWPILRRYGNADLDGTTRVSVTTFSPMAERCRPPLAPSACWASEPARLYYMVDQEEAKASLTNPSAKPSVPPPPSPLPGPFLPSRRPRLPLAFFPQVWPLACSHLLQDPTMLSQMLSRPQQPSVPVLGTTLTS